MNDIWTTVVGNVATTPKVSLTASGHPITKFRLASSVRRLDKTTGKWIDDPPSYVSVTCWRRLAENVATSVSLGQPVLVFGRLKMVEYRRDNDQRSVSAELEATSVGHDLTMGTSMWSRYRRPEQIGAGDPPLRPLTAADVGPAQPEVPASPDGAGDGPDGGERAA